MDKMQEEFRKVKTLIADYAKVYKEFEELQHDNKTAILPVGDQKTGVIGEYYAKRYIEYTFNKKAALSYEKSGELFDLVYKNHNGRKIKVQVKVVSAYSKTRTISTLKLRSKFTNKPVFEFLYLIALDSAFQPCGFWINSHKDITAKAGNKESIQGSTMKGTSVQKSFNKKREFPGSRWYNFDKDLVMDLRIALGFNPVEDKVGGK